MSEAAASAESANAQLIVSAAIVAALTLLGLSAIAAALFDKSIAAVAFGAVGVVIGSLATALNAPSGIANVLTAGKAAGASASPPVTTP